MTLVQLHTQDRNTGKWSMHGGAIVRCFAMCCCMLRLAGCLTFSPGAMNHCTQNRHKHRQTLQNTGTKAVIRPLQQYINNKQGRARRWYKLCSAPVVHTFLPSCSFLLAAAELGPAALMMGLGSLMPVAATFSILTSTLPASKSSGLLTVAAAWLGWHLPSLKAL